jgi:predicted TIM-barrel fold metal-dependent hydrolase
MKHYFNLLPIGVVASTIAGPAAPSESVRPTFDPPPFPSIPGKIILEEHANTNVYPAAFSYPYVNNTNEIFFGTPAYRADVASRLNGSDPAALTQRVAEMDKGNVSLALISLTPPGIQGILDPKLAVKLAPKVNDEFSAIYGSGKYASRFRFFCSVALQEPTAAVAELRRCMKLPGAVGVFLAGYTNTGGNETAANTVTYLDEPVMDPFWKAAAALGVPVYLHSRMPKPNQQDVYRGYEWMGGSVWGFSTEVAVETLRLMQSGLFDRYPKLQIVLGHLGEGISFSLYRMDQRTRHYTKTWAAQKTIQHYWENNIIITTSGVQSDSAFWDAMKTTTTDRVMFSADTPFETMPEMTSWFDRLEMNSITKKAIASGNARKWFKLDKA